MLTQVRVHEHQEGPQRQQPLRPLQVEDFTGPVECVMWPDDFARYKDEFADDRIFLFEAGVEDDQRNGGKMVVLRKLMTLDQARTELTKGMVLNLAVGTHGPDTVDRLGAILRRKKGPCVVYVRSRTRRGGRPSSGWATTTG